MDRSNHNSLSESVALNFSDVLIEPRYSDFSLEDIDLTTRVTDTLTLKVPIISSPMDTVTNAALAITLGRFGGLGIIHRNQSIEDQVSQIKAAKDAVVSVGAAFGLSDDYQERVSALVDAEVDVLCLDHAIGHSHKAMRAVEDMTKKHNIDVIAGSIATKEAIEDYAAKGVRSFRYGMGAGSVCISRTISGVGVPQLSALLHAQEASVDEPTYVIADGGLSTTGDIVKVLAAGARAVMLGSMLSGLDESPGDIVERNGKKYKMYRGMGSINAMKAGSSDRYNQQSGVHSHTLHSEGEEKLTEYKGGAQQVLEHMLYNIRTGFLKAGAKDIDSLQRTAHFLRTH